MDLFEIVGRLFEVVITDDPLRVAITRNLVGNVHFQVDVIHAVGDRRSQQHHAVGLAVLPQSLVFSTPTSRDDR